MSTDRKRNHGRGPGMTQTTVSLPADLLERIQRAANRTDRSRNKMIQRLLREAIAEYEDHKGTSSG